MGFDIEWVRKQFPSLNQDVNGQPAIFFDGPGGTQVPVRVIEAMKDYLLRFNANSGGSFWTSEKTDELIAGAHASLADLLGCDQDEVMIGANMTTLTFALSRALGRTLKQGDEILVTRLDHDANVAPWVALEEERGAVVKFVDVNLEDCTLNMDDFKAQLTNRTKIVAIGYASNAVGTINDVAEITKLSHAVGALVFIDAVHYAPHGPIDVRKLDCDFLACSPYKFFAPHAGAIFGKRAHLTTLRPYKVRPATEELPQRWETGTQNHEAMAGITAGIEYLTELGRRSGGEKLTRRAAILHAMQEIQLYERSLSEQLIAGVTKLTDYEFFGIKDPSRFNWRTPTIALRHKTKSPQELSQELGKKNIFTWDGNYYAIGLTERLGVEQKGGMLRIGLVHYNTPAEIDKFLAELSKLSTATGACVGSSK